MRLAFLRRADDPADEDASGLADATRPLAPTLVSDAALETILARCAAGEPSAAQELRRWQGNRLLTTLERILGDPQVAGRVMDHLLVDILSHAGAHRATGVTAEDWLFARLRFHVREAQRPGSAGAPLRAVPATPAPAAVTPLRPEERPPAAPVQAPIPAPAAADTDPMTVYPRLRRPTAPVRARPIETTELPGPPERSGWRRLTPLLLLWLGAGAIGFAGLTWLSGHWSSSPPPVGSAPAPSPPAAPPSVRELLGNPITDREPAAVVLPRPPAATAVPAAPAAPPAAAGDRIVIHYSAGNAAGAALARKVADALGAGGSGYVEVRAVPVAVFTPSVRYFHAGDRQAAERLVTATGPLLAMPGRPAPTAPLGFTDYDPAPRPGTLEIWVPSS